MFERYEIRVQLKETKPDGKVRSKFTRKDRQILHREHMKKAFDKLEDRSKHNLYISVHELDENGKAQRKPLYRKEIFPAEKILYTDIIKSISPMIFYAHRAPIEQEKAGLFKYFVKLQGLKAEDFLTEGEENYPRGPLWVAGHIEFYPTKLDEKQWKKLMEEWQEYTRYNNIENNIIAALSDPSNDTPEEFQKLLENRRIIDKIILEDNNNKWDVRRGTDGKYIISSNGSTVAFDRHVFRNLIENLVEADKEGSFHI